MIPEFLAKRVYKTGSLRKVDDGVAFDLKNILGPGTITGLNFIDFNGETYTPNLVQIITAGIATFADEISSNNPISVRMHQEGTLILNGAKELKEGLNKIILELVSNDFGKVQVSLSVTN